MRLYLTSFLFFLQLLNLSAQDQATLFLALEDRWATYQRAVSQRDFGQIEGFLYPPLFELLSKEDLRAATMRNSYHPDLIFKTLAAPIRELSKPVLHESGRYVRLRYQQVLQISFRAEAAKDANYVEAILTQYQEAHGAENVCFDANKAIITIYSEKTAFAIFQEKQLEWYFLELPDETVLNLSSLLPPSVCKQLL